MMAIQGPFLTSVIARLDDAVINLSAFGAAWGLALIIEAPVMMLLSAANTLVDDVQSFRVMRSFMFFLITLVTLIMLFVCSDFGSRLVIDGLLGLPPEVSELTRGSLLFLIPWPAAIGYRRFYQGVMIHYHEPRRVAWGTATRILTLITATILALEFSELPAAYIGATGLSISVVIESILTRIIASPVVKRVHNSDEASEILSLRRIISFCVPLILTSLIALGSQPLTVAFVSRSYLALESLAVIPVVGALIFLFGSLNLGTLETTIALAGNKLQHKKELRKFTIYQSIIDLIILSGIVLTPLVYLWYGEIAGLEPYLIPYAVSMTAIAMFGPPLNAYLMWQRAIIVRIGKTNLVTIAAVIQILTLIISLYLAVHSFNMSGYMAAASSALFGLVTANIYFSYARKQIGI